MQDSGFVLPGIYLPGTSVNKGKRKLGAAYLPPNPPPGLVCIYSSSSAGISPCSLSCTTKRSSSAN
jgi:hypothetical protein